MDSEGQQIRRHVSQTKKVQEWRQKLRMAQDSTPDVSSDNGPKQRPIGEKKAPPYLSDFIRAAEQDS